ncbi:MAG TPA: hypothetical protein VNJ70_10770 [Thermoanaerobaculia bacterium]|nr:hypothetical protein [Thermoanaerobaculia bacterium]
MKRPRTAAWLPCLAVLVLTATPAFAAPAAAWLPAHGFADVNGARLYYEVGGKPGGVPVVFLHGGEMDSRIWDG